mgnify:FL=1
MIPAIPDDTFVRGDVPMTKEEVRSISIAKLKIKKDAVVYDVGAGTGSISVEPPWLQRKVTSMQSNRKWRRRN